MQMVGVMDAGGSEGANGGAGKGEGGELGGHGLRRTI